MLKILNLQKDMNNLLEKHHKTDEDDALIIGAFIGIVASIISEKDEVNQKRLTLVAKNTLDKLLESENTKDNKNE